MVEQERCKVLIVDDEVLIRQGIKHYVNWEEEGFTMIGEASNGEEALAIIKKENPQIVITDIVMPIMDGIELTKKVKADYPEIEVIILSSFSDFDYVRSTFQNGVADYILKPNLEGTELLRALKQALRRLPNFALSLSKQSIITMEEWIQHLMAGHEPINRKQLEYESFPKSHFCLVGIDLKLEIDAQKKKKHITEQLSHLLDGLLYYPILLEDRHFSYVVNTDMGEFSALARKIKETAKKGERSGQSLVWILGEPFAEISELKQHYQDDLKRLRNYQFYFPNQSFFMLTELPAVTEDSRFELNHVIDLFKRFDFQKAFAELNQYTQYISGKYTMTENDFKATLGNIIFNITIVLEGLKFDINKMQQDQYQYFALLNEAHDVEHAISYFSSFLEEVHHLLASQMNENNQSNMPQLLSYIDQHYTEPISLSDLADHFHFNPSYLSTYFSQHHGIGFNEYLNQIRIDKAKAYLENKNVSIAEISGFVGYSDHSYFCKVFKKMTGMSPSKYRKISLG
ncbi:response regulator transcription factor [Bacillus sp. SD088]|uniref:response regulator transcription factor n=1 Tax=Bacillus sp. SD088 TaxID=2782012 RepID=UPI001A97C37A|nr:response regulator transcription factor [Bacillus sp. SD088]MBO0993733.1 response regulator transcription factor [Bacillus sp. SD088]